MPQTPNFDQGATTSALDQQKAALLAALAQGGSAMAQQQAQQQQMAAASGQAAAQQAASRSVNPQQAAQATQAANGQSQMYANIAAQQAGAGNTALTNMQQANGNYMSQVSAAVPLVHEQTQRELNSQQAAAQQAAADRAIRLETAQLGLQDTKARIAASNAGAANDAQRVANDKRRLDMEQNQLDAEANGGGDPIKLAQQDAARRALAGSQRGDTLNDIVSHEGTNAGQALSAAVMGKDGKPVDSYAAAVANLNMMFQNGQAKTPGGKDLDRNYMMGLLAKLYGVTPGSQQDPQVILGGGIVGRAGGTSSPSAPVGGFNRPGL